MKIKVTDLTAQQLPQALALAMKRKTIPKIDWALCGKLIEQEKRISLIAGYQKYTAMYIGLKANTNDVEVTAISPIEAIVKCFIKKKLGNEIDLGDAPEEQPLAIKVIGDSMYVDKGPEVEGLFQFHALGTTIYADSKRQANENDQVVVNRDGNTTIERYNDQPNSIIYGVIVPKPE